MTVTFPLSKAGSVVMTLWIRLFYLDVETLACLLLYTLIEK